MKHATYPVAVHIVLADSTGAIAMLRRANTGYADGSWTVPAGHVEFGETLHEAAIRELREETTVELRAEDLHYSLLQHKRDTDKQERFDVFFAAQLPPGQQAVNAEPGKCDALDFFALKALPEPVVPYVRNALNHLLEHPEQPLSYFWLQG